MNQIIIAGNLTRDPERKKSIIGGNDFTSFSVAVSKADGADYFRVSAWDALGEKCMQYLKKGSKVMIAGPVHVRAYLDASGDPRASADVTARYVEFMSPRTDEQPETVKGNGTDPGPSLDPDECMFPF